MIQNSEIEFTGIKSKKLFNCGKNNRNLFFLMIQVLYCG